MASGTAYAGDTHRHTDLQLPLTLVVQEGEAPMASLSHGAARVADELRLVEHLREELRKLRLDYCKLLALSASLD